MRIAVYPRLVFLCNCRTLKQAKEFKEKHIFMISIELFGLRQFIAM